MTAEVIPFPRRKPPEPPPEGERFADAINELRRQWGVSRKPPPISWAAEARAGIAAKAAENEAKAHAQESPVTSLLLELRALLLAGYSP